MSNTNPRALELRSLIYREDWKALSAKTDQERDSALSIKRKAMAELRIVEGCAL